MAHSDALAPRASLHVGDLVDNGLSPNPGTISRDALLDMSGGSLKQFLTYASGEDTSYVRQVHRLWRTLLITFRSPSVINGHMTAVCNTISVFLQSASSSPVLSVQTFAMSAETWMAAFDALLDTFDSGKSKPLRQVLNTLIKILGQHGDRTRARFLQEGVLSRMASIILLGKPVSHFKASMVIFDAVIRSGIPASRILLAIGRCYGLNHDQWDHRLGRQGMDVSDFREAMNNTAADESVCHFGFSIILAIADSNVQASAGTFFTRIMAMLTEYGVSFGVLWVDLVVVTLHRYPHAIEAFKNYLLPPILKMYPNHYYLLLHRMTSKNTESSMLQNALTIAKLGCDAGLLSGEEIAISLRDIFEQGQGLPPTQVKNDLAETDFYAALLTHSSAGVRIRAYEMLATSNEMTKPIRSSTLQLLSKHLVYLQGDSDPGVRGDIIGITNAMLHRLRRGSAFHVRTLAKPHLTAQQYTEHEEQLKEHEIFLDWFIGLVERELNPNCSFPRHISALRALQVLVGSGLDPSAAVNVTQKTSRDLALWPFKRSLHHRSMKWALYHLLLDPFEEVRTTTNRILKSLLIDAEIVVDTNSFGSLELSPAGGQIGSHPEEWIARLVRESNRLAALTVRADHADGLGRLLELHYLFPARRSDVVRDVLERLERALGLSDQKISLPAKDFSLHGYLMGLVHIVANNGFYEAVGSGLSPKATDVTVQQLLNLCHRVWHGIRDDLCVDSPELSHEVDTDGPFGGPKDFLSYSWRALRDSGLLMQAILQHLGSRSEESFEDNGQVEHLRTIHALCLEQLTAIRHRGAFSTVALTFALCCEQFTNLPSIRAECKEWYRDAFQILEDQSSKLTRRSAGIPAIMACLLIPSTSEEFDGVIGTLASLARSEDAFSFSVTDDQQTRLPQVHALNCLREIFTSSRFKGRTISWLTKLLHIAASSLGSNIWAIRNCGLMLFRACASRIGTAAEISDFETSESELLNQSEAMLDIAFKLLSSGQDVEFDSPELVFAGLDLLSRIVVPGHLRSRTRARVLEQLKSPIWMLREHAARLYASQMPETEALGAAINLISTLALDDQNQCQGMLVCSRELLDKHVNASLPRPHGELRALEQALNTIMPGIKQHTAPAVQSAFLDLRICVFALQHRLEVSFQACCAKSVGHIQNDWSLSGSEPNASLGRPFGSQLLSSSALNHYLVVLNEAKGSAQTLHQIFRDVAAHDLDAAAALLHNLKDHVLSQHHSLSAQVDFYVRIIQDDYDANITAAAIFGLCSCLEHIHESRESLITSHNLKSLTDTLVTLPYRGCRDLFNARIRGLGSVLGYRPRDKDFSCNDHAPEALSLWVAMLSSAAKDTTEAVTRLNAVQSLNSFRHGLLGNIDRAGAKQKLIIYSILYDFLNDDDEEIRDLAASTTSFILTPATCGFPPPLCPLAACHRFSGYMAERFSSNADFHMITLSRVMLPITIELDVLSGFATLVSRHSVKNQLQSARRECYDLFEEERQNLYLDDIREIEIWYSALGRISPVSIYNDIRSLVGNWVLDGLRELTAALPSLTSGPFGSLSKLEIIILFMRVIKLAGQLLKWEYNSDEGVRYPQESPHLTELKGLLHAARGRQIHPPAQKALEEGVQCGQLGFEQLERRWKISSNVSED